MSLAGMRRRGSERSDMTSYYYKIATIDLDRRLRGDGGHRSLAGGAAILPAGVEGKLGGF
jgi:hypothetical protein